MTKKTAVQSRTAIRLQAALSALAMDAKIDFAPALKGVTAKNLKARKPNLVRTILAMDGMEEAIAPAATGATPDDVIMKVLEMVEGQTASEPPEADEAPMATEPNAGPPAAAAGGSPDKAKIMEWLKAKGMSDDDMSELDGMMGSSAGDEDETEEEKAARLAKEAAKDEEKDKEPMVSKTAMDQAIAANAKTVEQRVLKTQREIGQALSYVRPWVGELAMDADINSGSDVYRKALRSLSVDGANDLHPDALKPVLDAQPKPGTQRQSRTDLAMDAASANSYAERFPAAAKIGLQ